MKKYLCIICFIYSWCGTPLASKSQQKDDQPLIELLNKPDYFALNDFLKTNNPPEASEYLLLLSKAYTGFYFNRPDEAIDNILKFMPKYQESFGFNNVMSLVLLLTESFGLKSDYKTAADILQNFISQIESTVNINDYRLSEFLRLYQALRDVPPQQMILHKTAVIPAKTDKIGLINIPVQINNFSGDFVLDTGAGHNIIYEQYAQQAGIRIIDHTIEVTGFSTVPMKLGIADTLSIGGVIFTNTIFLVIPKKLFSLM